MAEAVAELAVAESPPAAAEPGKRPSHYKSEKKVYKCRHCGQPKLGHTCTAGRSNADEFLEPSPPANGRRRAANIARAKVIGGGDDDGKDEFDSSGGGGGRRSGGGGSTGKKKKKKRARAPTHAELLARFGGGVRVEVAQTDAGMEGAWFAAEVIEPTAERRAALEAEAKQAAAADAADADAPFVVVRYDNLFEHDDSDDGTDAAPPPPPRHRRSKQRWKLRSR